MERVHRMQIWKKLGGQVLEKGAELSETYDMTSQRRPEHTKKRSFPIKTAAHEETSKLAHRTALEPHVDVADLEPPAILREKQAQRYALPSRAMYPLDDYFQVKEAVAYFQNTFKFMPPADRHEYCENLVKRAHALGIRTDETIEKYGSSGYAPETDIAVCLDVRRSNLLNEIHLAVLDKLAACRSSLPPEEFAAALHEFDKAALLDQHYGDVPDAYYTTFGKEAAEQQAEVKGSIIIGNEYATKERLARFLRLKAGTLVERFGEEFATEARKDPMGIFSSLPRDQKLLIMRMANADESLVEGTQPV